MRPRAAAASRLPDGASPALTPPWRGRAFAIRSRAARLAPKSCSSSRSAVLTRGAPSGMTCRTRCAPPLSRTSSRAPMNWRRPRRLRETLTSPSTELYVGGRRRRCPPARHHRQPAGRAMQPFLEAASRGEVFTTGSWYWRLSRALAQPGQGALSRALAGLEDESGLGGVSSQSDWNTVWSDWKRAFTRILEVMNKQAAERSNWKPNCRARLSWKVGTSGHS